MKTLDFLKSKGYLKNYSLNVTNIQKAKLNHSERGFHEVTFNYNYDGSNEKPPFNYILKNRIGSIDFSNKKNAVKFINTVNK